MPSSTDTRRRYSKPSSSKRTSLTSATTGIFVSKGRSNSTPNPEPVLRLNTRQLKRNGSKEEPINEQSIESVRSMGSHAGPIKSSNLPDVFTFLEKEEHSHSGAEDDDPQAATYGGPVHGSPDPELPMPNTPHYSDLEVHANETHEQDIWRQSTQPSASFHSDSGISMGSSSPDVKTHTSNRRQSSIPTGMWPENIAMDPFREGPCGSERSPDPPSLSNFASPPHSWKFMTANINDTPEAYYTSIPHMTPEIAPYPRTPTSQGFLLPVSHPVQEGPYEERNIPRKPGISGYDQLASSIHSNNEEFPRPIYRKFESLNNRMLLYLQDEISEIDERLRELDKQENQYYGDRPASRRAKARFLSHVQWYRMDLLNRSFAKVEQYSMDVTESDNIFKSLQLIKVVLCPPTVALPRTLSLHPLRTSQHTASGSRSMLLSRTKKPLSWSMKLILSFQHQASTWFRRL